MKKSRLLLLALALATACMSTANGETNSVADSGEPWRWDFHIGATAKIGTLGYGLEVIVPVFQDQLNVRAGLNTFSYDYDDDSNDSGQDLTYRGDLKLNSLPLLLDWHPFKGSFRLTTGLVFNSNEISATATCEQASCEFGDTIFDANTLGTTKLLVDLGGTQPYLGLGFGNAVSSEGGFSFAFDLGVVFQDVKVSVTPSANCQADPVCRNEVAQETAELNDDVKDFDLYPVISLGLNYKFK